MIAVSGCLAGLNCRYDGGSKPSEDIVELVRRGEAVCICPEAMGGLDIPRPPAEIVGGDGADVLSGRARVVDSAGRDVTAEFIAGAEAALAECRRHGVTEAILKQNSPSCGCGRIYDGSFSGRLRPGRGVTAALLAANGISIRGR